MAPAVRRVVTREYYLLRVPCVAACVYEKFGPARVHRRACMSDESEMVWAPRASRVETRWVRRCRLWLHPCWQCHADRNLHGVDRLSPSLTKNESQWPVDILSKRWCRYLTVKFFILFYSIVVSWFLQDELAANFSCKWRFVWSIRVDLCFVP
jgi:hypothetical protein